MQNTIVCDQKSEISIYIYMYYLLYFKQVFILYFSLLIYISVL